MHCEIAFSVKNMYKAALEFGHWLCSKGYCVKSCVPRQFTGFLNGARVFPRVSVFWCARVSATGRCVDSEATVRCLITSSTTRDPR